MEIPYAYPEITTRINQKSEEKGIWRQRKQPTGFARYTKIAKSKVLTIKRQAVKI